MRIGFFGDCHEDPETLEKGLEILVEWQCDKIIGLGDYIGCDGKRFSFGDSRDASRCIKLAREAADVCFVGNHDLYTARLLPKHPAGFRYPKDWYDLPLEERKELAGDKIWIAEDLPTELNAEEHEWVRSLPDWDVLKTEERKILISHYAWPDWTGTRAEIHEDSSRLESHFKLMAKFDCPVAFSGHGHAEGAVVYTSSGLIKYEFGESTLPDEPSWVVAPGLAREEGLSNGVMIYDTVAHSIHTIST